MAFVPPRDRVLEQSTSNSQSVFQLAGALDAGYNPFSASMAVGDTTFGGVVEAGVAFKTGLLTYSAANEITVSVTDESKGTFSAGGAKQVFMGWPAAAAVVAPVMGQCKLVKSGSNLVLLPFGGNQLTINGRPRVIPDGGITIAPTGLTPGTLYYIYAAMSGATMVLEASTTTHAVSTDPGQKGLDVKSGADSRTLVGFARPITGPAWADSATQRLVVSWFNSEKRDLLGALDTSSTSTDPGFTTEKTVSRCEFLAKDTDFCDLRVQGIVQNATVNGGVGVDLFIDGAAAGVSQDVNPNGINGRCPFYIAKPVRLAEGYHTIGYAMRQISGGTVSASYGIRNAGCIG